MHIAYVLLVHKNSRQVGRLLQAIYSPEHLYIIHADRKSPAAFHRDIAEIAGQFNCTLLDSERCTWGGWSMMNIQLRALRLAMSAKLPWRYFINLSGEHFPLRDQRSIGDFLQRHDGMNFVHFCPTSWEAPRKRTRYFYVDIRSPFFSRSIRTPFTRRRKLWVQPHGGSQWAMLHRSFCEYLLNDPEPLRLTRFFRHAGIPDEGLIQTAIMASDFAERLVPDNKQSIEFTGPDNSVRIWMREDVPHLFASGNLFARKFSTEVDEEAIWLLEATLNGSYRSQVRA